MEPLVLAHQGGWDELLFVLGPVAVIAGLLWVAKRRVEQAGTKEPGPRAPDDAGPS